MAAMTSLTTTGEYSHTNHSGTLLLPTPSSFLNEKFRGADNMLACSCRYLLTCLENIRTCKYVVFDDAVL